MKVSIFALGRTGLPLSLVSADSGFEVHGIDINKELVHQIQQGIAPFYEPMMDTLLTKHLHKNFFPKTKIDDSVKQSEYLILAIGTKFSRYPERASLTNLYTVIDQIRTMGVKGKTIILRITLPIGTTDEIKQRIEQDGLQEGKDFFLAFVPERLMEGKAVEEEKSLPKVIGCYNDASFKKVKYFFEKIGGDIVRVSNPKIAEFIKLMDNSWRNTCFAFANEVAFLSEANDLNGIEAIEAGNKGFQRNQVPSPGPVSGYCLGKDPYLLEVSFDKQLVRGFNSVWFYGRQVNDWLCVKIAKEAVGKNVLVAGISFKENIDDFRNSHSIDIINLLKAEDFSIMVTDPYLDKGSYTHLPSYLDDSVKKCTFMEGIQQADTIIFSTAHKEYRTIDIKEFLRTVKKGAKVIDLWNIYRNKLEDAKQIQYTALGRGDLR